MAGEVISPRNATNCHWSNGSETEGFREAGLRYLNQPDNTIGVVILAGGEGSRLKFDDPKGLFPVNDDGKTTLFDVHFRNLKKLRLTTVLKIFLFIMTSESTHEMTKEFVDNYFETNDLGLHCDDYTIFKQASLPVLDMNKDKIPDYMSPCGNGGVYDALRSAKNYDKCEYFNIHAVDNIATKVFEPDYLGCALEKKYDVLSMAVTPNQGEKVGAFVFYNNDTVVIEEYNPETGVESTENVQCNICNHLVTRRFMDGVDVSKMEVHLAEKDGKGEYKGTRINKQELFVFDAFKQVKNVGVLNVSREDHFIPLKSPADIPAMKQWFKTHMGEIGLNEEVNN